MDLNETLHKLGEFAHSEEALQALSPLPFDTYYEIYHNQALTLLKNGITAFIIPVTPNIQALRLALMACRDAYQSHGGPQSAYSCLLEIPASESDYNSLAVRAVLAESLGATGLSIYCDDTIATIEEKADYLHKRSRLPIFLHPPRATDFIPTKAEPSSVSTIMYDARNAMASHGHKILNAFTGETVDTTIHAFPSSESKTLYTRQCALLHLKLGATRYRPALSLASRFQVVRIGAAYKPKVIGERINTSGRPRLKEKLQKKDLSLLLQDIKNQESGGCHLVDVNVTMENQEHMKSIMGLIANRCGQVSPTPLVFDTLDMDTMEEGLKHYPGRALLNSVNGDPKRMERLLPMAKRYGAAVVCMPLGPDAFPQTARERVEYMKRIVQEAHSYGLRDEDLLLDAIVLTWQSSALSCRETLETTRLYGETFGIPSLLGVSNISYGLKDRSALNSQLLTMGLCAGANAFIINACDPVVMRDYHRGLAFMGFDPSDPNSDLRLDKSEAFRGLLDESYL